MSNHNWEIYPLVLGEADVSKVLDTFWSLSRDKSMVTVPILAWLLVPTFKEEPILVDTGFRDAERCQTVHGLGPHRTKPEWSLRTQLKNHGFTAEEIKKVILTHLHYDHAGGCAEFPNAKFIVQRTELQAAAAPMVSSQLEIGGGALFYDRKDIAELIDPLWSQVHLIEGDTEIAPGVKCFLFQNTHTPGSQAVYVQTEFGTAVILGDIARNVELNINQEIPPGIFYDLEATYRAMIRIKSEADIVLPSHDYEVVKKYRGGLKEGTSVHEN
ncbi:N-acyl homoserine lactonase family protein [Aeribacillus alveayuensis]|uniref:Glyoxylase-like metal-dependent hydrolase (Beta-lactamase superfamily II) n=1 Tax=Aeribacillus alveayuensis TaxID=279215 RepID=A0ABT9VSZ4_9BACI|nr:glyoxylase-like metal-dependent hydrolase (beta-lactamase superfamily II) [Bacillus alveayuensis]